MKYRIASIGFGIPGDPKDIEHIKFRSRQTLADFNIVLISLSIPLYQFGIGKRKNQSLSEDESEWIISQVHHWRDEIKLTCSYGNTVIAFAHVPQVSSYGIMDSGKISTYDLLPINTEVASKSGYEVVPNSQSRILTGYWNTFKEFTNQEVIIGDKNATAILLETKVGKKAVATTHKIGDGHIVLLPPLRFFKSRLMNEEQQWFEDALKVGQQLIKEFVSIHEMLRSQIVVTPPPEWAKDSQYVLKQETQLVGEIEQLEAQIEQIQGSIATHSDELQDLRQLKRLLFEQGHPLEDSIIETLRILGFTASQYKDGTSEFDAIFESEEGRFLGEAEGRDDKPIAIKKIRQLITNLQEDYDRDEVDELAHGVLFGNAYRLSPVDERDDFFTDKCRDLATRNDVALVRTPDLFPIVQYLLDNDDDEYKRLCREAILNTNGEVVVFPPIPNTEGQST